MRKPRVVIFDDIRNFHHDLTTFFRDNSYETIIVSESVTCPIYGKKNNTTCAGSAICCDIMVAVQAREQSKTVDIFSRQLLIGCKLTSRNKTIITHSIAHDRLDDITGQGITIFGDPLDFSIFEAWVKDCECRMDLTQRLPVRRRADRYESSKPVQFRLPGKNVDIDALTVNVSGCGFCLKTSNPLERGQVLHFVNQTQANDEEGIVLWTKELEDGWYLAGGTFCA